MASARQRRKVRFEEEREVSSEDDDSAGSLRRPPRRKVRGDTHLFNKSNVPLYLLFALILGTGALCYFDPNFRGWMFGSSQKEDTYGLKWWQSTIIYQIYPRSFQDSNGDGVGDIPGIISRLDYLEYLGVGAIWLSPFYTSPMVDFGYDISDFKGVDPLFGTLDDLKELIKQAHNKGIKVIVDLVPNHTSDQHPWFIESSKSGRDNPYSDYYVWHEGKLLENGTRVPPNNWVNVFGGSMWTWGEERQAYFLHQFCKEQPDLNYRNHKVHKEMTDVIQYWLDMKIDGFRVDAVRHMYEVQNLTLDEPLSNVPGTTPDQYEHYFHPHTTNQPEVHAVLRRWRRVFTEADKHLKKYYRRDLLMVVEVYADNMNVSQQMPYYHTGADMPFNFNLLFSNRTCHAHCISTLVRSWMEAMPEGKHYWPNWVIGNHDTKRITDKIGSAHVNVYNMLLLLLPGTPTTYYGEELGMRGVSVSYQDTQDPHGKNFGPARYQEFSRDPCRSPMQWSGDKNAGFSKVESDNTWLPVHPEHKHVNVQSQKLVARSPLQIYKRLAEIRKEKEFMIGKTHFAVVDKNVFSFSRSTNETTFIVAMNFGDSASTVDLTKTENANVTLGRRTQGYVVLSTPAEGQDVIDGRVMSLKDLTLLPGQGIVVKV